MDTIAKCAATAIIGTSVCLVIKKQSPEIAFSVAVLLTVSILVACSEMFHNFSTLIYSTRGILADSEKLMKPMLKCVVIAFVSKFGADICKDASQSSLASALELGGTLCAASTAMPLIINTIKMIGTIM